MWDESGQEGGGAMTPPSGVVPGAESKRHSAQRGLLLLAWLSIAIGATTGCAGVRPREGFADVQRVVSDRTGKRVEWYGASDADQVVGDRLRAILAEPLGADQAVQIALLNNRHLQAT